MGTRLGKLRAAVADLEEVLNELKTKETITDAEASHIQRLEQSVTKRYESLDDKWDKLEDQDTFKDSAERQKCESDYNEARKINKSIMNSSRHVLNLPRPGTNGTQLTNSVASGGPIKIEDTLKPKELLSEDMNLEEANLWFKAYRAHLSYNKVNMAKQDIQVRRAMLDLCLDSRMASALRAHEKVKDDTEIDATDPNAGCLNILREIFLERNPVWLRRHWYFQCVQAQDETVEQWWNRKQDKGRQCDLEQITAKDIRMLELIRGISSQALRKEFLKQKEPTLDTLIQIAKNWQRSTDVPGTWNQRSILARPLVQTTRKVKQRNGNPNLVARLLKTSLETGPGPSNVCAVVNHLMRTETSAKLRMLLVPSVRKRATLGQCA